MRLDEFQKKLRVALGGDLENATPANVREFVDQIQLELWREDHPKPEPGHGSPRIEISEPSSLTYEEMIRTFFVRSLNSKTDDSLIQLWILALDLAYSGIEEMHSESMKKLFRSD